MSVGKVSIANCFSGKFAKRTALANSSLNETFDFVSKEIILHYAQIETFELDEDKIIVINKQMNSYAECR